MRTTAGYQRLAARLHTDTNLVVNGDDPQPRERFGRWRFFRTVDSYLPVSIDPVITLVKRHQDRQR
jgi:hypothetical protein